MRTRTFFLGALCLAGRIAAQGLPSPLPPSNPAPIVYCPPERLSAGPPAAQHVLNVFLPLGQPPPAGWPVVVGTGYGGGASVPPAPSLSATGASKPYWNLVAAGIAVVHFGTPGIGNNKGLWYPPGHPSGRWESFLPAHDNPEKSAVWALQWVKVQTLYPFDLAHVGLRGSSGGAVLAIRTAMGPERARASGSAQVRASTRVAAILAIQPPTSAWALEQGPELTIPFPRHLEQAAVPGVAATQLSQVAPELQKSYSLMREAFASAEAVANNVQQPLCIVYGDPVLRIGTAVAPFDLDGTGFPIVYDLIKQPLQHDSWFGYAFWKRLSELSSASAAFHAANSVFAMRDIYALPPPLDYHTVTYSGGVMGPRATRIGHDWLVGRLAGPQPLVARSLPPVATHSRSPLGGGAAGGPQGRLVPLAAPRDGGATAAGAAVGLEGELGTLAWVFVTPASAAGLAGVATPAGALRLAAHGAGRTVTIAPDAQGLTRVELPGLAAQDGALVVQALLFDPREPPGRRTALTNALLLTSR